MCPFYNFLWRSTRQVTFIKVIVITDPNFINNICMVFLLKLTVSRSSQINIFIFNTVIIIIYCFIIISLIFSAIEEIFGTFIEIISIIYLYYFTIFVFLDNIIYLNMYISFAFFKWHCFIRIVTSTLHYCKHWFSHLCQWNFSLFIRITDDMCTSIWIIFSNHFIGFRYYNITHVERYNH